MGSNTDYLGIIPGAFNSILLLLDSSTGPFPSMGLPKASNTLPSIPIPMGTSTIAPVLYTESP